MIAVKRYGWAATALIALAICGLYLVATTGLAGAARGEHLRTLALALVAALCAALLGLFWRNVHRSAGGLSRQLERMARERQVTAVEVRGNDELAGVARSVNHALGVVREEIDRLREEGRELQIQSRIVEAERKHAEAIVISISDAVVVTNRFDELILANQGAEELLGFTLESGLRKNIDDTLHDGVLVRLIRETRSGGRSYTRKVVEHTIDTHGQSKIFNVTLSCVLTAQGEVSGVVAVLHDVTREKEIAQMKTDFVSNVSHELRTPLSSIKAYIEMLIDGEAQDEKTQREFYEIIAGETDRLGRLIDNILNISRIESGVVRVVREPLNLTDVARRAVDVLQPQARGRQIKLIDRLAPIYHQVEADKDMLYQAVLNLGGNAIKYTPEGGTVTIATSVDERRGVAVCEVSDTGVGISPEDLPHVFDKFYRVQSHTKMAKGTGLGLTLVKHIIESVHEGKLLVTSEAGKGSTFSFELPILH